MNDVLSLVLDRLDWRDILSFRSTCKSLYEVVKQQQRLPMPKKVIQNINLVDTLPPQSSFIDKHVLPNVRFKTSMDCAPEEKLRQVIARTPCPRPLHILLPGVELGCVFDFLGRIEWLHLTYLELDNGAVQSILSAKVPHVLFSNCNFHWSDWTRHELQYLDTSHDCLVFRSGYMPITPPPKMVLDLTIFEPILKEGVTSGDWKFIVQGDLTEKNRRFLSQVTGFLHLRRLRLDWGTRPQNRLETLSCTILCLDPVFPVTFPLFSHPSVQAIYALDTTFQLMHQTFPVVRQLFLYNQSYQSLEFVHSFPNLQVLELGSDKDWQRLRNQVLHVTGLQHLHTLVLRLAAVVHVTHNPVLTSIRIIGDTTLCQTDNKSLQDIYIEANGFYVETSSDIQMHYVPIVYFWHTRLLLGILEHTFAPLS